MPSKMPKPCDEARERFDEVIDHLMVERDVVRAPLFGLPAAKVVGGKAFVGMFGDGIVAKLGGDDHAAALALDGAGLFDPMGGRPMREWVVIPFAHADTWDAYVRAAESYVRSVSA